MALIHCPTCQKRFDPALSKAMPFCCERCRQIDLGRWLDEKFSLPAEGQEDAESPDAAHERAADQEEE